MILEENTEIIEILVHEEFESAEKELPKILEQNPDCSTPDLQKEFEDIDISLGKPIVLDFDRITYEDIEHTPDFYAVIPYSGHLHKLLWRIVYPSTDRHGNEMKYEMKEAMTGDNDSVKVLLERVPDNPMYAEMIEDRNQARKAFLQNIVSDYNEKATAAFNHIYTIFMAHHESRSVPPLSEEEMRVSSPF